MGIDQLIMTIACKNLADQEGSWLSSSLIDFCFISGECKCWFHFLNAATGKSKYSITVEKTKVQPEKTESAENLRCRHR